jgi:hypothetical protein
MDMAVCKFVRSFHKELTAGKRKLNEENMHVDDEKPNHFSGKRT